MTIAVDLGRKATKQTNKTISTLYETAYCILFITTLYPHYLKAVPQLCTYCIHTVSTLNHHYIKLYLKYVPTVSLLYPYFIPPHPCRVSTVYPLFPHYIQSTSKNVLQMCSYCIPTISPLYPNCIPTVSPLYPNYIKTIFHHLHTISQLY